MNVDRRHKLIRRYQVTNASVHDSQKLDDVLDPSNTASGVWADSAYRIQESEEKLRERGLKSQVCRRGARGKPLSEPDAASPQPTFFHLRRIKNSNGAMQFTPMPTTSCG